MINSCMENFHCAAFEKFKPNLPKDTDLPFISIEQNVKNCLRNFLWLRGREERH